MIEKGDIVQYIYDGEDYNYYSDRWHVGGKYLIVDAWSRFDRYTITTDDGGINEDCILSNIGRFFKKIW